MKRKRLTQVFPFLLPIRKWQRKKLFYLEMLIDGNKYAKNMLIGGFPCQPFSMMGEERGFEDARGTLFFRIAEIIKHKIEISEKPKVIVLENVRTLMTHDKGKTFATIKRILEEDLNYNVFFKILNSADYGIPQTRNRTYIVCFDNKEISFSFSVRY